MIETRQGKLSRLRALIRLGRYEPSPEAIEHVVNRLTRILCWDHEHNKAPRRRKARMR